LGGNNIKNTFQKLAEMKQEDYEEEFVE